MYAGAHSCPSNYEENIGRNAWALHRNYPYAGVTSSGIWLLLAGVVTTWYVHVRRTVGWNTVPHFEPNAAVACYFCVASFYF
jgi:hypothetical protein